MHNFDKLPQRLKEANGWLLWKSVPQGNGKKPRKIPYYVTGLPRHYDHGTAGDRHNLTTFEAAAEAFANSNEYAGLGLALLPEHHIVALDFDNCVNNGVIDPTVSELIDGTYAEISPSGKGVRAFMTGALPDHKSPANQNQFGFEVFNEKGFVTVTGNMLPVCELLGADVIPVTEPVKRYCAARFGAMDAKKKQQSLEALKDTRELIPEAMKHMTVDLADGYHTWTRIGKALKGAYPNDEETALQLWHTFSGLSPKYDPETAEKKWHQLGTSERIGAGTIYWYAEQHGWTSPVPLATPPEDDFDPVNIPPTENPNKHPRTKLFYRKPSDIKPNFNHIALVEDLLDEGAMSVMYGESNTGKTFVALDLAFHISTGTPWDNKRVLQGGVIYVAAEGGKSAENRVEALKRTHNLTDFPLYLVPCSVDLLHKDADTKPLIDFIKQVTDAESTPIKLIVIDTLSRALAGGNENDSQDMGAFVRNIDTIRSALGSHLLVVHHTGKDKAKGARGHSLLRAATDTEIEISTSRIITVTKQRDMEATKPIGFTLENVELGQNAYGKTITSCVIRKCDAAANRELDSDYELGGREAVALNAFKDLWMKRAGADSVGQGDWGDAVKVFDLNRVPGCEPWPESGRGFNVAFQRAREKLTQLGYVTEIRKMRWAEPALKSDDLTA